MSDTPIVQITETKVTLAARSAWLRWADPQWALAGADGSVIAMFPGDMYDQAIQAAGQYLAALSQAEDMRVEADGLVAKAHNDVTTLAAPAPVQTLIEPEPPTPVPEPEQLPVDVPPPPFPAMPA